MDRYEAVFAGTGGQGLIVVGMLMGLAATRQGLYVAQSQSYGVSARGGYCQAEVVLSKQEILYPKTVAPDVVIALTTEALSKFQGNLQKGSLLIYDSDVVNCESNDNNVRGYGLTSLVRSCGGYRSLNICALGAMLACNELIPAQIMRDTLADFFKGKNGENNIAVFDLGYDLIKRSN